MRAPECAENRCRAPWMPGNRDAASEEWTSDLGSSDLLPGGERKGSPRNKQTQSFSTSTCRVTSSSGRGQTQQGTPEGPAAPVTPPLNCCPQPTGLRGGLALEKRSFRKTSRKSWLELLVSARKLLSTKTAKEPDFLDRRRRTPGGKAHILAKAGAGLGSQSS